MIEPNTSEAKKSTSAEYSQAFTDYVQRAAELKRESDERVRRFERKQKLVWVSAVLAVLFSVSVSVLTVLAMIRSLP